MFNKKKKKMKSIQQIFESFQINESSTETTVNYKVFTSMLNAESAFYKNIKKKIY